jgi:signal transduction histidine kinase
MNALKKSRMDQPKEASSLSSPSQAADEEFFRRQLSRNADEVMCQFLMSAVHDLRSAQRGIGISAELLKGTPAPEGDESRELLDRVLDNLGRLDAIVTGMGRYASALHADGYHYHEVSIVNVIRSATVMLAPMIQAAGAVLEYGELPKVVGDRDRLTELFRNLMENSLKYRGTAQPKIDIQAQPEGAGWVFRVRDNGSTPASGDLPRPFRRLHGSDIPGAGLGLWICKKIVENHGGRLWIERESRSGTTVAFTLPPDNEPSEA